MGCYEDLEAGDDFILWGNNMARDASGPLQSDARDEACTV